MTDSEAELRQLVILMATSMQPAGTLLSEIATSKSQYADEAMAAFSHIVRALNAVRAQVDKDLAK
jgi:hypothetical protein